MGDPFFFIQELSVLISGATNNLGYPYFRIPSVWIQSMKHDNTTSICPRSNTRRRVMGRWKLWVVSTVKVNHWHDSERQIGVFVMPYL